MAGNGPVILREPSLLKLLSNVVVLLQISEDILYWKDWLEKRASRVIYWVLLVQTEIEKVLYPTEVASFRGSMWRLIASMIAFIQQEQHLQWHGSLANLAKPLCVSASQPWHSQAYLKKYFFPKRYQQDITFNLTIIRAICPLLSPRLKRIFN